MSIPLHWTLRHHLVAADCFEYGRLIVMCHFEWRISSVYQSHQDTEVDESSHLFHTYVTDVLCAVGD